MTCQHCVASVSEEVGELAGVTGIEVDLATGRLTVHGDVAAEAVADAVTTAGFHVRQP
jgi:copper chaperone CopZ